MRRFLAYSLAIAFTFAAMLCASIVGTDIGRANAGFSRVPTNLVLFASVGLPVFFLFALALVHFADTAPTRRMRRALRRTRAADLARALRRR